MGSISIESRVSMAVSVFIAIFVIVPLILMLDWSSLEFPDISSSLEDWHMVATTEQSQIDMIYLDLFRKEDDLFAVSCAEYELYCGYRFAVIGSIGMLFGILVWSNARRAETAMLQYLVSNTRERLGFCLRHLGASTICVALICLCCYLLITPKVLSRDEELYLVRKNQMTIDQLFSSPKFDDIYQQVKSDKKLVESFRTEAKVMFGEIRSQE